MNCADSFASAELEARTYWPRCAVSQEQIIVKHNSQLVQNIRALKMCQFING